MNKASTTLSTKAWYWSFALAGFFGIYIAYLIKATLATDENRGTTNRITNWKRTALFAISIVPIFAVHNIIVTLGVVAFNHITGVY